MRPATLDIGASSGRPPCGDVTVSYAIHTAPLATSSRVWSGSGARCRYVNSVCPECSRGTSSLCGSFTLTIRSGDDQTSSREASLALIGRLLMRLREIDAFLRQGGRLR